MIGFIKTGKITTLELLNLSFFVLVLTQVIFFFPFILKQFSGMLYAGAMLVSVSLIGISFVLNSPINFERPWIRKTYFKNFLFLYCAYICVVLASTLFHINDQRGQALAPVIYPLFFFLIAITMYLVLENRYILSINKVLNAITLFFACLAILGTALIALKLLPSFGKVYMESTSEIAGTGERDVYGLTLGWMNLNIGPFRFPRLQSFASEAGNFALPVGIAIFYYLSKKKLKLVAILLLAFLFTFSIGNWLCFAAVIFLRTLKGKILFVRYKRFLVGFIVATALVATIALLPPEIFEFFDWYLSTKFGSDGTRTSFNTRYSGLFYMINEMGKDNVMLLGYGYNARSFLATTLANGWTDPFLKGGISGMIICFTAYFLLIAKAIKNILKSDNPMLIYVSSCMIYISLVATQRGYMDTSLWTWWIVILFMRVSAIETMTINPSK